MSMSCTEMNKAKQKTNQTESKCQTWRTLSSRINLLSSQEGAAPETKHCVFRHLLYITQRYFRLHFRLQPVLLDPTSVHIYICIQVSTKTKMNFLNWISSRSRDATLTITAFPLVKQMKLTESDLTFPPRHTGGSVYHFSRSFTLSNETVRSREAAPGKFPGQDM